MADFLTAVKYVIENESSEFVNDPDDLGHATKFGITQETLATFRQLPVSVEDVKGLTEDEAKRIYEAFYWQPLGCYPLISQAVATAMLDCAVLDGVVTCAKWAQRAAGVSADGHIGPATQAALNAVDFRRFLATFIPEVQNHYVDIAIANPVQIKFLKGWLARSQRLITLFE